MSSLEKRLQGLEEGNRTDQLGTIQLDPEERAIVLRNKVRSNARSLLQNQETLARFLEVYGPDEPSVVDVEPLEDHDLHRFGIVAGSMPDEMFKSGLYWAYREERFPSKDNPHRASIIGPGGTVPEPDYVEKFSSYESRHSD